ncbi:hypothetical protein QUF90_13380 [Desulfococcaceae bacterium HSG9]|nr:hypothetical protein [Desulfococcaceae bacterium HSG9]
MAENLSNAVSNLRKIITDILGSTDALTKSSGKLPAVSAQMATSAEEMNTQSDSVVGTTEQMSDNINVMDSAAEEMSVNIRDVTSSAEQMSQNMNAVATAIEEMSSLIKEVARSTQKGSHIADTAYQAADSLDMDEFERIRLSDFPGQLRSVIAASDNSAV